MTLLSDSAFKLFLWLCLHASRSRGSVCANPAEIARSLNKPEAEIVAGLQELVSKGGCRPIHGALIEIADRFWPYQRSLQARPAEDVSEYVSQVKRLFLERRCVQSVFTAADDQLAIELYRKGIPLEKVERAILLGCLRKYATGATSRSAKDLGDDPERHLSTSFS